jgi:hypothetical protein
MRMFAGAASQSAPNKQLKFIARSCQIRRQAFDDFETSCEARTNMGDNRSYQSAIAAISDV